MNAFVISDLHASWSDPFAKMGPAGRPDRFDDLLGVLTQVETEIIRRKPTDLLILGDLLHRRHFVSFRLLNPLYDALFLLADLVEQTTILVGNHDYEDDTTHGLHVFGGLPHTCIVDRPSTFALSGGEIVNVLPYVHDPAEAVKAVELFPTELPLFGHYGTEGVPLESDYWLDAPLKLGEVARFPYTVFGHIHKPSDLLSGRVTYIGAPLHRDFGDRGPRGGLHITDAGIERVPLRAPQFVTAKWPRIPMPPVGSGYLRLLNVPPDQLVEAREMILAAGWRDGVPMEAEAVLAEAANGSVQSGLALDEGLLRSWVEKNAADLPPEERQALVDEGVDLLRRVAR